MDTLRILHTADWHLGAENTYLGALSGTRKYEILLTAEKIVSICNDENIDILLMAGDILDSNNVDEKLVDGLFNTLDRLCSTKAVIALGNHDPLTADSPFKNRPLPQNVFLLDTGDSVVEFKELTCKVYGRSFGGVYEQGSNRFSITPDEDSINIMVLHGEVKGDLSSPYNSITPEFIKESNMDYIALGHIHKPSEVLKIGNTHFAYSGCPEGQGFDESGKRGVYIGNVSKRSVSLEYREIAKRTHHRIDVDITEKEDIIAAVKDAIVAVSASPSDDLFRITLTGKTDTLINTDEINARISPMVYALRLKDEISPKVNLDLLREEHSLKGCFVKQLLKRIEDATEDQKPIFEKALQLGLKSFIGGVAYSED